MRSVFRTLATCTVLLSLILTAGCASRNQQKIQVPPAKAKPPVVLNADAYDYYMNGVIYEQEGLYAQAIQEYQRALSYAPLSADIRMSLGELYYRLGRANEALNALLPLPDKQEDSYSLIGDCYRDLDRDQEAIAAYKQALSHNPVNVEVNYELGVYAARDGNLTEAAQYFKTAALESRDPEIYEQTAKAYAGAGEFDSAAVYYKAALSGSGDDPSIYGRLAIFYLTADNRDRAIAMLRDGIEHFPDAVYLMGQLIEVYAEAEQIDSAVALSERLLAVDNPNYHVYERVGQVLMDKGVPDLAGQFFRRTLSLNESSVPALFYLGRIAIAAEQYDTAREYFTELSEAEPEIPDGWINLAIVYSREDSPETAMAVLNEALKRVTASRDDVRFYLAQLLSNNKQRDSAVAVLKGVIEEGGDTLRALFGIGATYEQMGEFDKSVQSFELLLSIDSTHAQSLNYLGYMLADRNVRLDESLRLIERALAADSTNAAYIDSYAWVLYRLDRYEEALVQIEKAVSMMPDDATVREHLGDIYFALGQRDNAHAAWTKALALDPGNESLKEKLGDR